MIRFTSNRQLRWISTALITFYFGYSIFLINKYTFSQGLFFAFSLLSFLGVGIAGLFEFSGLAISALAVGMPQLITWFVDACWFCFFKASFFGTAEGRFQPGLSVTDFLLGYYPLLLLPLALIVIKRLPKPQKTPLATTALISAVGLWVSRFTFIGIADPNCSNLACIDALAQIPIKYYPWAYIIIYTLVCLVFAYLLRIYFVRSDSKSPFARFPKASLLIYLAFCVSLITGEMIRLNKTPRFSCFNLSPVSSVSTECGYTLEYSPGFFSLFFTAMNHSPLAKHCNFYMIHKDTKETMYAAILLKSQQQITSSVVLPYPTEPKGASVSITSECVNAE